MSHRTNSKPKRDAKRLSARRSRISVSGWMILAAARGLPFNAHLANGDRRRLRVAANRNYLDVTVPALPPRVGRLVGRNNRKCRTQMAVVPRWAVTARLEEA